MPFIQRPAGFNNDTLDLLDKAMMGIWLDHAARIRAEQIAAGVKPTRPPSGLRGLLVYRARTKLKCY